MTRGAGARDAEGRVPYKDEGNGTTTPRRGRPCVCPLQIGTAEQISGRHKVCPYDCACTLLQEEGGNSMLLE